VSGDTQVVLFGGYGIASQAILLAYFAARRWRPSLAERYGWAAYAFGAAGLFLGLALAAYGASFRLFTGPLLLAGWAGYGWWVDLARKIDWRRPMRWSVAGPYLALYLGAQMFLWWPLWNVARGLWAVYLALFAANTLLNLLGHVTPPTRHSIPAA
jgi:hypothetical protein